MMMTSSSAQMLLLSTPLSHRRNPSPPQARDPALIPLWSHRVLNPGSPHFIVPQIILDNTRTHPHTHTHTPRAIISAELCSVSCSLCFSLLLPTAAMAFNWNVCLPLCGPLESHKWPQLICYPHYGWFALQGSAGSPPAVGAAKDCQEGCTAFFFHQEIRAANIHQCSKQQCKSSRPRRQRKKSASAAVIFTWWQLHFLFLLCRQWSLNSEVESGVSPRALPAVLPLHLMLMCRSSNWFVSWASRWKSRNNQRPGSLEKQTHAHVSSCTSCRFPCRSRCCIHSVHELRRGSSPLPLWGWPCFLHISPHPFVIHELGKGDAQGWNELQVSLST